MIIALAALLVSYIPALLLYFYLRNLRKDDPAYRKNCRRLLGNGVLCSLVVALLALALSLIWGVTGIAQNSPLLKAAIEDFVLAAFVEEFVKYLTAGKVIRKNEESVSWLDCIAFCAIVGIGFQMIETVVFLVESGPGQTLVRGFTMGHPAYGMLMGFFIGKALYTGKRAYRIPAFILPFIIHGLYDFSLSEEFGALNDNLVFVPFIMIIIEFAVLIRILVLIKKERKGTKFTTPCRTVRSGAYSG